MKKKTFILYCGILASVAFITFLPSLQNGFTNWDDDVYVTANPDIQGFSPHTIGQIFSKVYLAHYLPVTMLSYMTEYSLFRLDPFVFHLTNLLLHIINSLLVFALMYALSGKYSVGLLVSLLFAIHPLRVESVAWIAERKDVLSAFFYFVSLLFYIAYRKKNARAFYVLCMISLLISLLSKIMSLSQPFVLLLIDYLMGRRVDKKSLLEKVPFFAIVGIFVFIGYCAVGEGMNRFPLYSIVQRILAPAYEIVFYLVKSIVPVNLCAFYGFPDKPDGNMTIQMVVSAAALCGIAAAVYYSRRYSKKAVFGFLFFLITLVPVLQIVSSGSMTIVAERYTYVPMIGIYFIFAGICGYLYTKKFRNSIAAKSMLVAGVVAILFVLGILTYQRCGVWKNSLTLWNDVISKFPVAVAYGNRGIANAACGDYDRAIEDYNHAVLLNPKGAQAYSNRGNAYYTKGEYDRAFEDYEQAISIDPKYSQAYSNRGVAYIAKGDYDRAIENLDQATRLNPRYAQAYNYRGTAYHAKGDYDDAIQDYNRAIAIDPKYAEAFYNRGLAYCYKDELDRGIMDYGQAIALDPNYALAYSNRGVANNKKGDYYRAVADLSRALQLDPKIARAYYSRGLAYQALNNPDRAHDDIEKACELGLASACDFFTK